MVVFVLRTRFMDSYGLMCQLFICWDRLCMSCWNCNRPLSLFFCERRCYFLNDTNRQIHALCSFSYKRKTSDVHYDSGELRPKTVLGFNEYELLRIFVIYIDEILKPTRSLCRELTIRSIEEHFRRCWLKVKVKFITFLVKLQFVIHPIITSISNKSITSRPFIGSMIYPIK